ncbi:MAG TPA: hypothetical protein DIT10_10135 [Chryseobacterium sp.]|nr:hypothetical protein [Chryseobacterium sp.]
MKIERLISWFDKKEENLIGEYNIDTLSLDVLKEIFTPSPEEDPMMYDPYIIHQQESEALKKYIDLEFDFDRYIYQIDCFQV